MFALNRAKNAVRHGIARYRRTSAIMAMHRAASFFESAWHNEGSELSKNGEQFVLEKLKSANFRLAVDAGANVGGWLDAALQLWPDCEVHAFEVAPETYKILEKTTHLSANRSRAKLHKVGLSDEPGSQTMYFFPDHLELTCDIPRHNALTAVPFQASLTTLDVFCHHNEIAAIDFLKVDVEGAEHRVIKGAQQLLEEKKIACIQFEYGAFSIQTHFLLNDYYALLSDQFVIGKIFPNYVAFGDYDFTAEDFRFSNYLCIARERSDLRRLFGV